MKITKRILAIVMAMLMLLSTCAVAASAAGTLQAMIDAAAAESVVTMTGDTTESVVITKDLTLDLGGYELKGVPGTPAITIVGANVTITNGHVVSQFANVKSLTMLETVVNESPAAINVKGGSVAVEGVRAVGSMTRIPTTSQYHFPTGSAIALTDGATASVKQSSLVGRYGVNNEVTNETAGGSVMIEDAIMMGFMRAVKNDDLEQFADDTEKVNAADRIEGFLNSGVKLEDRERKIVKAIFADRVMLYTKSVQDEATVSYSTCTGEATVEAHEDVTNIWPNNTSTDCSYKYVPEYVVLADGTLVKLDDAYTAKIDADQVDDIQIKYRLTFDLQPDIQGLTGNFDKYLEDLYNKVIKTAGEVYDYALEKYTTYTALTGNILKQLDQAGSLQIGNEQISALSEYKTLRRAVVDLGGKTAYAAVPRSVDFDEIVFNNYYGGTREYPADGMVGTLDRVAKLKEELESFLPFSDTSKWADLGYWAFENYEEVLSIIDEAQERIENLQRLLDGDWEQKIIERANLQSKRASLDKVQKITADVKAALDKILASHTIQNLLAKAENNKSELKPYINKFISIYNNHEKYFTPDKFLDGSFAKAYALYGDVTAVDETEHQFGEVFESIDKDTHCSVCSICGEKDTPAPHDFDCKVTEATCTEDGLKVFTCEDCGYTYSEVIQSANGHDWSGWEIADGENHERFCNECGKTETKAHSFSVTETVEPTCTEDGYVVKTCETCGYSIQEDGKTAEGHKEGEPKRENEVAPTCGEDGSYDEVIYCTVCGEELSRTKDVVDPATGNHDFEDAEYVYLDENQHAQTCNVCGQQSAPSAHDLDAKVLEETTCLTDGLIQYTCKDCEYTFTKPDPAPGHHTYDGTWEYYDEAQHEHFCTVCGEGEQVDHNFEETGRTPATCTEPEYITLTCSDCGYPKTVEGLSANGHTKGNPVRENEVAPTCGEDGSYDEVIYCTVCREELERTKNIVDPATGEHNFEGAEYVYLNEGQHVQTCNVCGQQSQPTDHQFKEERVEPTCTKEGSLTKTCELCEYTFTTTLPVAPHTPREAVRENEVAPTCEDKGGYDEVVRCDVCEQILSTNHVEIPANGHTPREAVKENEVAPTCEDKGGYDEIVYCDVCEKVLSTNHVDVPALGHDWGEWQDNDADTHIHECARCHTTATAAHEFSAWTVVTEATTTQEGKETRSCFCGRTETRTIPKVSQVLTLTDSITNQTPANKISVKAPYTRRGKIAVTLTASEQNVQWKSSKPDLLTVDENGNVKFVRLCVFCRSATITATTPDGREASCVVSLKLKWWHYILFILFGCLWY